MASHAQWFCFCLTLVIKYNWFPCWGYTKSGGSCWNIRGVCALNTTISTLNAIWSTICPRTGWGFCQIYLLESPVNPRCCGFCTSVSTSIEYVNQVVYKLVVKSQIFSLNPLHNQDRVKRRISACQNLCLVNAGKSHQLQHWSTMLQDNSSQTKILSTISPGLYFLIVNNILKVQDYFTAFWIFNTTISGICFQVAGNFKVSICPRLIRILIP